jgi:RNA polymerase sigma-70 factor (ECF subfamily)
VFAVSNADSGLILRCQADDAAAFNEIVARFKNRVFNYVNRMVHGAADAEDITQEVFVRAYLNINSFQGRASLNTWLFRIATNICIDYNRKHSRLKGLTTSLNRDELSEDAESELQIADDRYEPERLALNSELGAQLHAAMNDLPEKHRSVVLLHDIEGMAYEEVAAIVDCPVGTVKSRLFNARMALRQKLSRYVDGSLDSASAGRGDELR